MPGTMIAQMSPIVHARRVFTGISGSSVFATADRTSGYGESSSAARSEHAHEGMVMRWVLTEVLGALGQVGVVEVGRGDDI